MEGLLSVPFCWGEANWRISNDEFALLEKAVGAWLAYTEQHVQRHQ
jgi:hypothetical protein